MHPSHRTPVIVTLLASACIAGAAFAFSQREEAALGATPAPQAQPTAAAPDAKPTATETLETIAAVPAAETHAAAALGDPISHPLDRVIKTFGMYITPETSPIKGDRFTGYHVGTDFETTPEEQDIDVPIFAVCDGPLLLKTFAKGYGGVAIQRCTLDGQEIQVTYGHLRLASIDAAVGQDLRRGEQLAVLGTGHSPETDGVRKHLHLGIHVGDKTDLRGYVPTEEDTAAFLDARALLTSR